MRRIIGRRTGLLECAWTVVLRHRIGDARCPTVPGDRVPGEGSLRQALSEHSTYFRPAGMPGVEAIPLGSSLDLVGIALRAPHRDADAILRGLARHH
jgi:hypothetical protein